MTYEPLSLAPFLNSVGATYDSQRREGLLNAWGNSYPAEELPLGSSVTVGGIPFRLPEKAENHYDIVEPLGQTIELSGHETVTGVAFLCCGEMGEQYLAVRAVRAESEPIDLTVVAKGFSVLPGDDLGPQAFRFTHLHYAGDYDLDLLTCALWCFEHRFEEAIRLVRLELGVQPLVRIAGLTLIRSA
jgi:hypothetical protein